MPTTPRACLRNQSGNGFFQSQIIFKAVRPFDRGPQCCRRGRGALSFSRNGELRRSADNGLFLPVFAWHDGAVRPRAPTTPAFYFAFVHKPRNVSYDHGPPPVWSPLKMANLCKSGFVYTPPYYTPHITQIGDSPCKSKRVGSSVAISQTIRRPSGLPPFFFCA